MRHPIKEKWTPEELGALREAYVRAVQQRIDNGAHSPESEKAIAEAIMAMAKEGCMDVDALVSGCRPAA